MYSSDVNFWCLFGIRLHRRHENFMHHDAVETVYRVAASTKSIINEWIGYEKTAANENAGIHKWAVV